MCDPCKRIGSLYLNSIIFSIALDYYRMMMMLNNIQSKKNIITKENRSSLGVTINRTIVRGVGFEPTNP